MDETTPAPGPTASSLKNELRESLERLKTDFEGLKHFVNEIVPADGPAPISLGKDDLNDLLAVTLDIQDAGNNIAFEAGKIKEKLQGIIT
jgi:hypothetical protein